MLTRTRMRNRIKAVTEGLRCTKSKNNLDEKLLELVKNVKSLDRVNILNLIGYLTKTNLSDYINNSTKDCNLKPLACYVSIKEYSNKPIGSILMKTSNNLIDEYGNPVGHVRSELRLATDEEVDKLTDKQIDEMIKDYSGC